MGRFIVVILDLAINCWAVVSTVMWVRLRRQVNGIDHPEFWLPRSERRAHARKLLRREDDAYTQRMVEQAMRNLQEGNQL